MTVRYNPLVHKFLIFFSRGVDGKSNREEQSRCAKIVRVSCKLRFRNKIKTVENRGKEEFHLSSHLSLHEDGNRIIRDCLSRAPRALDAGESIAKPWSP